MLSFLNKMWWAFLKKKNPSLGGKTSLRHCTRRNLHHGVEKRPKAWLPGHNHIYLWKQLHSKGPFFDTLGSSSGRLAPQLGAQLPHYSCILMPLELWHKHSGSAECYNFSRYCPNIVVKIMNNCKGVYDQTAGLNYKMIKRALYNYANGQFYTVHL